MVQNALGLIEAVGMAAAIEAADTAVKAANIELLGYELTKGGGMVLIKLTGDVGAIKAAVAAGAEAARKVNKVVSTHVIARPHSEIKGVILNRDTVSTKASGSKVVSETPPASDSSTKSETDAEPEPAPAPAPEAAEEAIAEPVTEPVAEPMTEPVTEPVADEAVEETVESVSEPDAEPVSESETAPKTAPETAPEMEAATEATAEPVSEPVSEEEVGPHSRYTCNLCGDPRCPRKKGEPRSTCMHHKA
ncbi:BMC domain-containing protein [Heliomicrobium gestii]|uniref:BMC domain-containing protein n=1 Tax=Heliomicrobium gestii TaxID=2699 RepID=UPI00195DC0DE|nr:BMC domain-containing protein [Heliomicrobium gestii]MBM7866979.1 microcompartment protein CcmL/EutN [Heliomicrobium gestii]